MGRNPEAFSHGGPVVFLSRPEALAVDPLGADFDGIPALTAEQCMPETRTRQSVKAMVAEGELMVQAAAREVAVERLSDAKGEEESWAELEGPTLEALLTPDAQLGQAPVRLLDARFLIKLAARDLFLLPRHSTPDDAFIPLERLRMMPPANTTGLRILCISHIWLQPDHPDPRRYTLQLVAHLLRVLLEEHGGTFAVFLDFSCLCSREGVHGEQQLFHRALQAQGELFVHPYTWVAKVTALPKAYPRGFVFRAGTRPNVAKYHERGWTYGEAHMASLIKVNTSHVLNLGHFGRALQAFQIKARRGELNDEEMRKWVPIGCDMECLLDHCRCHRLVPLTPGQFQASLEGKAFTRRSDFAIVSSLYRRACLRMKSIKALDYSQHGWGDREAFQVAKLIGNGYGEACIRLFLGNNKIGDEGVAAIAAALRSARCLRLESIDLRGNPAKAESRQLVRDAVDELLAQGVMLSDKVRIFGAPEHQAVLIQRRVRQKLARATRKLALLTGNITGHATGNVTEKNVVGNNLEGSLGAGRGEGE